MMRFACGVEYDGVGYSGWQRQSHARSVQAEVEAAISRVANHPLNVICAGRTDAGVHATSQVIHFDSDAERSERSWLLGANANLQAGTRIQWVRAVDDQFHARFSATARSYRYVILNSEVPGALLRKRVAWEHHPLDEVLMQEGAGYLLGRHDFSSFRAMACQAHSPVRTVHRLDITRSSRFVYLDIEANAFLHHMVRNIAGVLISVGRGDQSASWVESILAKRDRRQGGVTAPAQGLYLVGVRYPQRYCIAAQAYLPVFG